MSLEHISSLFCLTGAAARPKMPFKTGVETLQIEETKPFLGG
jgi:hypothetical protein